jgi:hypothetical protein
VIGDAVWWNLIQTHMKKRVLRLPFVIGHYRTWPLEQAEFRFSANEEHTKQAVSLI